MCSVEIKLETPRESGRGKYSEHRETDSQNGTMRVTPVLLGNSNGRAVADEVVGKSGAVGGVRKYCDHRRLCPQELYRAHRARQNQSRRFSCKMVAEHGRDNRRRTGKVEQRAAPDKAE